MNFVSVKHFSQIEYHQKFGFYPGENLMLFKKTYISQDNATSVKITMPYETEMLRHTTFSM